MKLLMTMVLECDDNVQVADLGQAKDGAKAAFKAAGFKVHGLRLTPIDEPAKAAPVR
jgi:hypothetical protein